MITLAGEDKPAFLEWDIVPGLQQTKAYSQEAFNKYEI